MKNRVIVNPTLSDILKLRHDLLRADLETPEKCYYIGDEIPENFHLGVYVEGSLASAGSFHKEIFNKFNATQSYRLRGMATYPKYRRKALGTSILLKGIDLARDKKAEYLWFNARVLAIPFYQGMGFQFENEIFELPFTGPHVLMWMKLN